MTRATQPHRDDGAYLVVVGGSWRGRLAGWFGAAALLVASVGPVAGQAGDGPRLADEQVERLWRSQWRDFAQHYVEHNGEFILFSSFDPACQNSSGTTVRDYERETAREFELPDGTMQRLTKPREEIDAATRILPNFSVGSYGYIESGEVAAVLATGAVRLTNVRLLGEELNIAAEKDQMRRDLGRELAEQGFRDFQRRGGGGRGRGPGGFGRAFAVVGEVTDWRFEERERLRSVERENRRLNLIIHGFDTARLTAGRRWPAGNQGLHIAIVSREGDTAHAVPVATLRQGLNEEQFARLLESRQVDRYSFAHALVEARRTDGRNYKAAVLAYLQGDDVRLAPREPEIDLRQTFE